jgi:hypothetical protein
MDGPKSRRFEGRAAFIAQLAAIRAEVETGVSLTSIYDARKGALGIGYRYFHQLVARHIGLARDRFSDRATPPPAPPSPAVQPEPPKSRVAPSAPPTSTGAVAPQDATPTETSDGPQAAPRPRRFQPHKGPAKRGDLW